jgi:hypothetical protein
MKTKMITHTEYIDFIREALTNEDYHTVDTMNKMALETQVITIDTYLAAAHLIVDTYLAQQEDR